jgi:hypothetical protein
MGPLRIRRGRPCPPGLDGSKCPLSRFPVCDSNAKLAARVGPARSRFHYLGDIPGAARADAALIASSMGSTIAPAGRSQPTAESRNRRDPPPAGTLAMSPELIQLGQQALSAVASGVARGAPLVKCQLLASQFYEALRIRRRQMWPGRNVLFAAVNQCHRTAIASASLAEPCQPIVRQGNDLEREPYREVGNDQEGR